MKLDNLKETVRQIFNRVTPVLRVLSVVAIFGAFAYFSITRPVPRLDTMEDLFYGAK